MREILFRGKRIDNGEWVKGFYCQVADESDGGTKIKQTILVPTFLCQSGFKLLEVEPETVGQYTGLTDKNGKKIFEGDIIKAADSVPEYSLMVIRNEGFGCFIDYYFGGEKYDTEQINRTDWFLCDKIIGNIHDDPDLLGGDDE